MYIFVCIYIRFVRTCWICIFDLYDFVRRIHVVCCCISPSHIQNAINPELKFNSNFYHGPEEDDLNGLNIDERKFRRSGPINNDIIITDGSLRAEVSNYNVSNMEVVLSDSDCASSPITMLAEFARQASNMQ